MRLSPNGISHPNLCEHTFDVELPAHAVESGTNASGQSYGAGDTAASDAELPDLVAAIGTDGVQGFIEKSALDTAAASPDEATALGRQNIGGTDVLGSAPKTVPVYASDGTTQISEFTIS